MGLMIIKIRELSLIREELDNQKIGLAVDTYSLLWLWPQRAMLTPPHCSAEIGFNTVLSSEATWDPSKGTVEGRELDEKIKGWEERKLA